MTGARGFIGGRMVAWLEARSIPVVGWTREQVDLEDHDSVAAAVLELDPSLVLHLAAVPARSADTDWQLIAQEVSMLDALAAALPEATTLVYCGSMAEIGHSGIHDEQVWCRPNTLYGMAKFAGTNRALALAASGRSLKVARLFGVYGPGEASHRLIPTLVRQLVRSEQVKLSDGLQVRDFVHVDDVCTALWCLASRAGTPTLVNIGTGKGVKVGDVSRLVADILKVDAQLLQFGAIPRRHVDEEMLVANTVLLHEATGLRLAQHFFEPENLLCEYVRELARHFDPKLLR